MAPGWPTLVGRASVLQLSPASVVAMMFPAEFPYVGVSLSPAKQVDVVGQAMSTRPPYHGVSVWARQLLPPSVVVTISPPPVSSF